MNSDPFNFRCGIGYDSHRLVENRKLLLGGVDIPFTLGLLGHSDGDVLSHAIVDALLGAAGMGDIGTHFPDTDSRWKGASSMIFLQETARLLAECQLRIVNIDSVVIIDQPKLAPHFLTIRQSLAGALGITPERLNVKAKTSEGMWVGAGPMAAAHACALLAGG